MRKLTWSFSATPSLAVRSSQRLNVTVSLNFVGGVFRSRDTVCSLLSDVRSHLLSPMVILQSNASCAATRAEASENTSRAYVRACRLVGLRDIILDTEAKGELGAETVVGSKQGGYRSQQMHSPSLFVASMPLLQARSEARRPSVRTPETYADVRHAKSSRTPCYLVCGTRRVTLKNVPRGNLPLIHLHRLPRRPT